MELSYSNMARQHTRQKCGHLSFSKLLIFWGPGSVEELVSVEDASSVRFARYGIKINILTCLWFSV